MIDGPQPFNPRLFLVLVVTISAVLGVIWSVLSSSMRVARRLDSTKRGAVSTELGTAPECVRGRKSVSD